MQVDLGGAAALIGATGGLATTLVSLYLQLATRTEQKNARRDRDRIEQKLDTITKPLPPPSTQ